RRGAIFPVPSSRRLRLFHLVKACVSLWKARGSGGGRRIAQPRKEERIMSTRYEAFESQDYSDLVDRPSHHHTLSRILGWVSIGLGATELLANRQLSDKT